MKAATANTISLIHRKSVYAMTDFIEPPRFEPGAPIVADEELARFLAGLTPDLIRDRVRVDHRLEVIAMICAYVPGYGPH